MTLLEQLATFTPADATYRENQALQANVPIPPITKREALDLQDMAHCAFLNAGQAHTIASALIRAIGVLAEHNLLAEDN